ncbi:hypothetical protein DM791_07060 [Paenarthrobacter nitroguajacolicus]|nr:hypothetical protein [Paenarthrobacter nitroguajacolicus]
MDRILARETSISDLLQFLSDRNSEPWAELVGFMPKTVEREAIGSNQADLLLTAKDGRVAAIEVKLGHIMSAKQQANYESLPGNPSLYLAALSMDRQRVDADSTLDWSFLSLAQVFEAWTDTDDGVSRALANHAFVVLSEWDWLLSRAFGPARGAEGKPLNILTQKFLARVLTRRIAADLRSRGRLSKADVASGGGLPLIQAWTPIRGEDEYRCFMAEVRWQQNNQGGKLRFGVDFGNRPGEPENEEIRRTAHELSQSMDTHIDFPALKRYMNVAHPQLAGLLTQDGVSRPVAKGDWEQVVRYGFAGTSAANGKKNSRQQTTPAFFGDSTLRFQATADVDFGNANGQDIVNLLDATLSYLSDRQPA